MINSFPVCNGRGLLIFHALLSTCGRAVISWRDHCVIMKFGLGGPVLMADQIFCDRTMLVFFCGHIFLPASCSNNKNIPASSRSYFTMLIMLIHACINQGRLSTHILGLLLSITLIKAGNCIWRKQKWYGLPLAVL